jgi:P27 family predicted phage terminase small subunit
LNFSITAGGDDTPLEPPWDQIFSDEQDLAFAREQWGTVTRQMHDAAILSVANGHAIKRLIEFRVQYEHASRHVAAQGAILAAAKAKIGQFNPFWAVMKHADDAIRALEGELGIAPIRRSRAAKVQRAKPTMRPSDRYLSQ